MLFWFVKTQTSGVDSESGMAFFGPGRTLEIGVFGTGT